jgi:hypothetical protein
MAQKSEAKPLFKNPVPYPLKEKDWLLISRPVQLKKDAKPYIEWSIGIYQCFSRFEGPRPSKVKARIRGLITRVDALLASLRSNIWVIFSALTDDINTGTGKFDQTPRLDTCRLLDEKIAELEKLHNLLLVAQDRVARARPGPSFAAMNIRDLVRDLSKVLEEYSDFRFERSDLIISFVEAVCRVANPNIGSGSIDEAMKRVVKIRKNQGAQSHHGIIGTRKN